MWKDILKRNLMARDSERRLKTKRQPPRKRVFEPVRAIPRSEVEPLEDEELEAENRILEGEREDEEFKLLQNKYNE